MRRHLTTGAPRHGKIALLLAVKVGIVALVVVLPSWLALSLGAAHGIVLLLLAIAAVALFVARIVRNRSAAGPRVLTAHARIPTARASRYLVQLCQHASKFDHQSRDATYARPAVHDADWSDTHGTLDLGWGRCTVDADPTGLTVRVEAADEANLRRIQDAVAGNLERFGRRDQLSVTWQVDEAG